METLEKDFANIVRKHKSTIYTVCYMFSQDNDEVEDLFQETLINLWKGFAQFRGDSSPATWIWKVSLNTCISFDRKKRRRGESVPLSMSINLFEDDDNDSRQIEMLRKRINQLGPFDRAIVLLWLENLSYEEIGEIVGSRRKMFPCDLSESENNSRKCPPLNNNGYGRKCSIRN